MVLSLGFSPKSPRINWILFILINSQVFQFLMDVGFWAHTLQKEYLFNFILTKDLMLFLIIYVLTNFIIYYWTILNFFKLESYFLLI